MNPAQALQALNLLMQIAAKAPVEYQVHLAAQKAAADLKKYIEDKKLQPVPEKT